VSPTARRAADAAPGSASPDAPPHASPDAAAVGAAGAPDDVPPADAIEVRTESLGGSALARAALAGRVPTGWYPPAPAGPDEWHAHVDAVRRQFSAGAWLELLGPALDARGAAAERLAEVAGGAGVVVTTGQQPGLFGGPLYTLSKALSARALADAIQAHCGVPAAPVFWAATDDTDFAEASRTYVAGAAGLTTLAIASDAPEGTPLAAVRLGPDVEALGPHLRAAAGALAYEPALRDALATFAPGVTVGDAYAALLRRLLEPLGIAVLDASHPAVRDGSFHLLRRALLQAPATERAVAERGGDIALAGFSPQVADVPGRALVFRYGADGRKARVPVAEARGLVTKVARGELGPNVLLRPVVERFLLPTVAYMAGPGEYAYFAQVSAVAAALGVAQPLALPRWSGTVVEPHVRRVLTRLGARADELSDVDALAARLARARLPPAAREAVGALRASIDEHLGLLAAARTDRGTTGGRRRARPAAPPRRPAGAAPGRGREAPRRRRRPRPDHGRRGALPSRGAAGARAQRRPAARAARPGARRRHARGRAQACRPPDRTRRWPGRATLTRASGAGHSPDPPGELGPPGTAGRPGPPRPLTPGRADVVGPDRSATDGAGTTLGSSAESPGAIDPTPASGLRLSEPRGSTAPPTGASGPAERTGRAAALVASGILGSRVLGFVRQGVFSGYLGASPAADAYNAALRIPNILQNLFGEGVLSASFIPVYAGLLARGERETADRVAAAVGAVLATLMAALVAVGMLGTPLLVATVAAGFEPATRELTVQLVRIVFPAIGLLVMGAWCLGILNSHRKFLLSYLAPVASNLVLIATLLFYGPRAGGDARLATILAWGAVAGSAAQLLVQLPTVLRVAPGLVGRGARPGDSTVASVVRAHVRTVGRNFAPVLVGRGVVQISGYVDNALASLVAQGAVTVFTNAQTLYQLPGSLFGMSIAAAELPAMAALHGADDDVTRLLRARLSAALRRVAFFVVPSAMAFLALGDVFAAAAFGYGRFTPADVRWVWGTLAGSAVGLLASTMGRLYASTFYALKETRTPLRFAVLRVGLTLALGYVGARYAPRLLGVDPKWGTAGLTATSGVAGWVEFFLLRRALNARVGVTGIPARAMARLWGAAALAAAAGWSAKLAVGAVAVRPPALALAAAVGVSYGAAYLAATAALGEGESAALVARLRRRRARG
jgi:putative peptidoglycan lipid II flippase